MVESLAAILLLLISKRVRFDYCLLIQPRQRVRKAYFYCENLT